MVCVAMSMPASAQVSKEALLEMVSAPTATQDLVSLVERDCVDFPVDAATVADLAGRVPRQVLMAAIDCAEEPPESRKCRVYRALAAEPRLADFPLLILWLEGEDLELLEVSKGVWLEEGGVGFRGLSVHADRHEAAVQVVKEMPGVGKVKFESDADLSGSKLAAEQRIAILDACSRRARVLITSEPPGASVRIDGEEYPAAPLVADLLPDEHFVEVSKPTYELYAERLLLEDGERRDLHVDLVRKAAIEIGSEPSDAVLLLDGTFAGHTPVDVFVDGGRHRLELVSRGRPTHREDLFVEKGELLELEVVLAEPADPAGPAEQAACVETNATGRASRGWRQLGQELRGVELEIRVPLYEVVTSRQGREIPSTRVLDGRRVLFKPEGSKSFVERPLDLIGLELGGALYGETAVEVLESAPGRVTITGLERKRSTLRLDLVHQSGDRNALFLDFSLGLDLVEVSDVVTALCTVAAR